ncbi:hypothetical protein N7478_000687 [Penicillium angulare]|uniref:uncharacterized protein n=1 Tax=Penicillium angulare TaxID=116970 RepID=UPI00253FC5BD|nr:uncharacterized protein N7478_000687 [Penicillium angulare]KAJ5291436.1 hypothetical protein N7478_000687 [Penicillium angulare]
MSDPSNYVVGWICAVMTEYVAAQVFLDEEHEEPTFVSPNDTNNYKLGKMGQHNVVIAALPDGGYGTDSAANVATNMLNSFLNVRIGLMVGIGGGVPSEKHDIRLGDIVVSASRGSDGGVFQYDFGKATQGQGFQYTRLLNQPPTILRTAMTGIRAQYEIKGHQLEKAVQDIFEKHPRLHRNYKRPEPSTDRLFQPRAIHTCEDCALCAEDPSKLVLRAKRTSDDDDPVIHYGLIASGNKLMKNALIRDRLAAEKDVLCFEMEAAGLINTFPCLVIRGICDYSDSHKNKEWQGYAAMVAAAYAKDLLRQIPSNRLEAERKISDILSEDHRDIAQKQLELQENAVKRMLSEKQEECLQLFRLSTGGSDATYEWYKERAGDRVEGTCMWFLKHANFQGWLERESGPLLVSADPGCGKSVLARYLIDNILPRSSTICYFFFKDQDQNTVRQALCALLHQIFSQKPSLIEHAMEYFKTDGPKFIKSTIQLWNILEKALKDPRVGSIIIVLDALDECAESEFENLMQNLKRNILQSDRGRMKFLLTSRPYEQIIDEFRGLLHAFPHIRIPGEEKSDEIGQEVSHVIQYRVKKLAKEKGLSKLVKNHLAERLLKVTHRTYLWVYLVFDYLKATNFKKTLRGVDSTISTLPANVNEAYEQILNKSKDQAMVRRALSIILAANRPLTISEMNIALNVNDTLKCIHDLDLEENEDFRARLRTVCGLFVSIHHDKIYFLHQTAREFLLADTVSPVLDASGLLWQHSITSQSAHTLLAEICVIYLDFLNEYDGSQELKREGEEGGDHIVDLRAFLIYAANNWGMHARTACISTRSDLIPLILSICGPNSGISSIWFEIYRSTIRGGPNGWFNDLLITSYFGIEAVVKVQLERDAVIDSRDSEGRTPLSWAAQNGHQIIVEQLVEKGAVIDSRDSEGRTPLSWAAQNGHQIIVEQLVEKGAYLEAKDRYGSPPLLYAVGNMQSTVIHTLVHAGARLHVVNNMHQNSLHLICKGPRHKDGFALLEFFISSGLPTGLCDVNNMLPLLYALENRYEDLALLLLDRGVEVNSRFHRRFWTRRMLVTYDIDERFESLISENPSVGLTALHFTAVNGIVGMTAFLIGHGANPNALDDNGDTPLHLAIRSRVQGYKYEDPWVTGEYAIERLSDYITDYEGEEASDIWATIAQAREDTVQQLLNSEAIDINIANNAGDVPLHVIPFEKGQIYDSCAVLTLLLDYEVEVSILNMERQTCLHLASKAGNLDAIRILLKRCCDIALLDKHGLSPIHYAVCHNHSEVIQLMFEERHEQLSRFCVQNNDLGKTMLHYHTASVMCSTEMISILLELGCDINRLDADGNSVLSQYLQSSHMHINYDVYKLLRERSSMERKRWADQKQRNLLHLLMRHWSDDNVLILEDLMDFVSITAKDVDGMGIEHHGAIHGAFNKPLTRFLRKRGYLNLHSKDSRHKTPLQYAEEEANRERHPDLFEGHRWQKSLENLRHENEND